MGKLDQENASHSDNSRNEQRHGISYVHAEGSSGSAHRWSPQRLGKLLILYLSLCFIFILHFGLGIGSSSWRVQHEEILKKLFPSSAKFISTPPGPTHPCVFSVPQISREDFATRQFSLAQILTDLNGVAYIAEPGAQTKFFGNFSNSDWKLSERPLFIIITPRKGSSPNDTKAEVSVLTPKFEATRAKLLSIPFVKQYIEWAEEENPYAVAAEALGLLSGGNSREGQKLFIDNSARHFHYDGFSEVLAKTGLEVTSAPQTINLLREQKSEAEIEIMKCAHEATLVAIRHVHKQMTIGMRESEARNMMSEALTQIGLSQGGCLTLFGENAALPHGSGTDKPLGVSDFALFDCTATLHGYWSDVTRTVALPSSQISSLHLQVWKSVSRAQWVAGLAAHAGVEARSIDRLARVMLSVEGLEKYFTHRLGHGIGLEGHEHPYLNGGNKAILQINHAFSIEPGVYIEGKIGVRLEDCMYIDRLLGISAYLTAGAGGPSVSPWEP